MNQRNAIRAALLFAASVTLSACTAPTVALQGFEPPSTAIAFQIQDDRPPDDKTSKIMSLWVTACDYGIYRIGDERTNPSRLVLLQRDLEDALGNRLNNDTFDVLRYSTFINGRAQLRATVAGMYTGIVPSVLNAAGEGCTKEETTAGWFDASEVTTPNPPVIIEIEGAMNGKKYFVRSVYSTDGKPDESHDMPVLFAAMRKADAALADQLGKDLVAP